MKKIVCITGMFLQFTFGFSQNGSEQQHFEVHPELAVGVAYGRGFSVLYWGRGTWIFPGPELVEIYSTPVLTLDFQQPIFQKFCLGLAVSHQAMRVGYQTGFIVEDYGDRYDRVNFALRPLFNFPINPHWSWYIGLRAGYTYWHFSSVSTPREIYKDRAMPSMYSGGVFAGARYSFGRFGLGSELSFGTAPYVLQVHGFYRFKV